MSVATSNYFLVSPSILSSSTTDRQRLATSRQCSSTVKRSEQRSLPRNHVFNDAIPDSFLVSSNNIQSSVNVTQQDGHRLISTPHRRYVSSFKTLVNSTSGKNPQRLTYVKDSVIIVKLSKENATENTVNSSQQLDQTSSSMAPSNNISTPSRKQSLISPSGLGPVIKQDPQKRRTTTNDSSSTTSANNHLNLVSNSLNSMATSTSSQSPSNPSLFPYRNSIVGGNTIRQRVFPEPPSNNVLLTTDRIKSNNASSSMRPTRQPLLATTTTTPTASTTTQTPQRNTSQNSRPRIQQEKLTASKDIFEYPDPFTNCPQEFLSKLAQLTKLQMETIEWERKRRFTKKKSIPNGMAQGKDSP